MTNADVYSSNERIDCRFLQKDFAPDGDLTKTLWTEIYWTKFDRNAFTGDPYPQAETQVAARWTPHYIYFGFRSKYSSLNIYDGEDPAKERWELWNRDVVEVFLNPEPDRVNHYYEFEIAPNNQWIDLEIDKTKSPFYDPLWASGFEHATRIDEEIREWTCEMRISKFSIGVREILPKSEWRINFFRADGDDSQRRLTAWSIIPGGDTFHTPTRFGLIRFVD
jgi:Carbohydrate family 9 binding domain-like